MTNNKIQIKQFYFENGVSDGYYVVDAKGVNWAVQPTKQLALDWYNKLNKTDIKIFELDMYDTNIQVGDVIGFYTCCNADRKRMIGLVEYKDQLGFITVIDGVQYELRKLIDIEVANENNAEIQATYSYVVSKYRVTTKVQIEIKRGITFDGIVSEFGANNMPNKRKGFFKYYMTDKAFDNFAKTNKVTVNSLLY